MLNVDKCKTFVGNLKHINFIIIYQLSGSPIVSLRWHHVRQCSLPLTRSVLCVTCLVYTSECIICSRCIIRYDKIEPPKLVYYYLLVYIN